MTQESTQPSAPLSAPITVPVLDKDPWPALWALVLGFFMIMVDSTIVTVATPAIIEDLHAEVNSVVWVTSAYLLAYAVPVLITGRLGDRFGQKRLYMIGLVVFTLSSLWCGLTGTIEGLIIARVFQGFGASMMTPQTMAIITRIFPAERRGQAMALWGATAGVALLVGPLLGGILVDGLGWEWIFFINIPVGVIGFAMAATLVPTLATNPHRFDWLGVALSGAGMFLLVFGIQEGHQYDWGTVTGQITVWRLIVAGLVVFGLFVLWQARNRQEPLVPLGLFRERNFSLANIAISTISFAFTAMAFPLMLYAQLVRGLSPTKAALLLVPMALFSIVLAPVVGRLTDRVHPRLITVTGFSVACLSLVWLALELKPESHAWQIMLPMALLGAGSAGIWAPLSATATRNLPMHLAGAGAGVYNATRQVGAVLGSAGIALLMDSRLAAQGLAFDPSKASGSGLPEQAFHAFSKAMSQALLLPAGVLVLGVVAVLFFTAPAHVTNQVGAPPPGH
ncbi:MAG: DHA2 family efflux MFS transporter permease subunit [Marmoricola sp.]